MVVDSVQDQPDKIKIQFGTAFFDITGSVINSVLELTVKTPFDTLANDNEIRNMFRVVGYTSNFDNMSRPFLRK